MKNYRYNIIKTDEIFYNYYKYNPIFKKTYLFLDIVRKKILALDEIRKIFLTEKNYLLFFLSYFKKKLTFLRFYYMIGVKKKISDYDIIKLLIAVYIYKGIVKFIYRLIKLIIFSKSRYIITIKKWNHLILFRILYYYK